MSLKPYPEYQDSGFKWLGSIPKMWRLNKFRHVFAESSEVNGPSPVGEMLSISGYRGVELKNYDDENQKRSNDQLETYRVVRAGQLAVNTMWLNYAGLGVSSLEGHVSPAYRAYWIHPSMNRRYVHYLMRSAVFVDGYTANLTGIRPNSLQMSRPALMSFPVIVPPIAEQQTIADYLDRETSEIDAFIADQEELIALLVERRTATIIQAVTKGLDMNSQMKESGVEWLKGITTPTTWSFWKLGRLVHLRSGETITSESIEPEGMYPVFGGNGLRGYTTTYTNDGEHVLIGRQGALCGNIKRVAGQFFATEHAIVVYPLQALNTSWLSFILQVMNLGQYSQSAAQPGISVEVISQKRLPVPPLDEQNKIATYLDRETAEIDAAIADAREIISLSKERRAAVISAAVTGKIDVRGLVAPAANDVEGVSVGVA